MKRKAVLIGASPPSEPLLGVTADVELWKTWLETSEGGGWKPNEILNASYYSKKTLLEFLVSLASYDYSMIVFAGHGYTTETDLPWTELNVILGTGESLLERELNPGNPRCCIVLDCCRTRGEDVELVTEKLKTASLEDAYKKVRSRQVFESSLYEAEKGAVVVYSTGDDTAAADERSFSQYLVRTSVEWGRNNRGVLSLKDAVKRSAAELKKTHPQQKPEYNGGRRLRHYPFAISL